MLKETERTYDKTGNYSFRERLARALHAAANVGEYNLSQRMMSVHGSPTDPSYFDAADMILDTGLFDRVPAPARQDLSAKFSAILDDRWPLTGKLLAAVEEYVDDIATVHGACLDTLLNGSVQPAPALDKMLRCPKCGTVTQPRWHYNDWRLHPTCNERARNESLRLKEPVDGEHLHFVCECGHERVATIAADIEEQP